MKTYTKAEAVLLWARKIRDGVMPAVAKDGACHYRLGEKECAIGALISREDMPNDSGGTVLGLPRQLTENLIEGVPLLGLRDVQVIHDSIGYSLSGNRFGERFFGEIRRHETFKDVPESVWVEALAIAGGKRDE